LSASSAIRLNAGANIEPFFISFKLKSNFLKHFCGKHPYSWYALIHKRY